MKVAITVWENRISPVFDASHTLLIAEIEDSHTTNREYITFDPEQVSYLVETLTQLGITALICGAISEIPANTIEANRIELIPFISGSIDEVLNTYSKDYAIDAAFMMPGCSRQCRKKDNRHLVGNAQKKRECILPKRNGSRSQSQGKGAGTRSQDERKGKRGRGKGKGKLRGNANRVESAVHGFPLIE